MNTDTIKEGLDGLTKIVSDEAARIILEMTGKIDQ